MVNVHMLRWNGNNQLKIYVDGQQLEWKNRLEETQTLRAGCSYFSLQQIPFSGARDDQNLKGSVKLRKSLVKPMMQQNISSWLVLTPEIVMHNAFNVILWTSADICIVMHDDLGWHTHM